MLFRCFVQKEWMGGSLSHWIVMQRNSRQFTQLGIATDWERGGGGSPDFYDFLQFDCSTIRSSSTWLRKSIHWIQTRSFLLHLIHFSFSTWYIFDILSFYPICNCTNSSTTALSSIIETMFKPWGSFSSGNSTLPGTKLTVSTKYLIVIHSIFL